MNLRNELFKLAVEEYGEDRVELNLENIIIHFPEITLENENNEKHTIHDMFLKIITDGDRIKGLAGARTTFTQREIDSYYTHSHISRGNSYGEFGGFCLGYEMNQILDNYNKNKSIESLTTFFYFIDTYLSTESLKGGPYTKMQYMYGNSEYSSLNYNDALTILENSEISLSDNYGIMSLKLKKSLKLNIIKKIVAGNNLLYCEPHKNIDLANNYLSFKGEKFNLKKVEDDFELEDSVVEINSESNMDPIIAVINEILLKIKNSN